MNAEQAWQTVLAQLQMDMPRASFDTWVRDTRPVGYENGTLTVGVRNAYARDCSTAVSLPQSTRF